jgi:hypothetical protein
MPVGGAFRMAEGRGDAKMAKINNLGNLAVDN